jgi:hypothetical protein
MKGYSVTILIFIVTFAMSNFALSSTRCEQSFTLKLENSKGSSGSQSWRGTPGPFFMGIRSNARHYWEWIATQVSTWKLPNSLLAEGWVTGDPHALNFADIVINGSRRFRLTDIDDAGHGYFFFDFIKHVVATRASNIGVSTADLLSAYRSGLRLEDIRKSGTIRRALRGNKKENQQEEAEMIRDYTNNGKFRLHDKGNLLSTAEAPPNIQKLLTKLEPEARFALKENQILDTAVRVKSTGGSQGVPRLWFLVETPEGRLRIFEFKLLAEPSVAATHRQSDPSVRVAGVLDVYWKGEVDTDYRVLKIGDDWYWMRPRQSSRLGDDQTETPKQREALRDVTLYIANQMGKMVARQSSSMEYRTVFQQQPEAVDRAVEFISSRYLDVAKSNHVIDNAH